MYSNLEWDPTMPKIPAMLIGEDEQLAELHRMKLEMDGYDVTLASREDDVEGAASKRHPALLFLEIRDDKEDIALYSRLCEAGVLRKTPMVLLTPVNQYELVSRGVALRPCDFVIHEPPLARPQPRTLY